MREDEEGGPQATSETKQGSGSSGDANQGHSDLPMCYATCESAYGNPNLPKWKPIEFRVTSM